MKPRRLCFYFAFLFPFLTCLYLICSRDYPAFKKSTNILLTLESIGKTWNKQSSTSGFAGFPQGMLMSKCIFVSSFQRLFSLLLKTCFLECGQFFEGEQGNIQVLCEELDNKESGI